MAEFVPHLKLPGRWRSLPRLTASAGFLVGSLRASGMRQWIPGST
jgi:hypothetical protein